MNKKYYYKDGTYNNFIMGESLISNILPSDFEQQYVIHDSLSILDCIHNSNVNKTTLLIAEFTLTAGSLKVVLKNNAQRIINYN